MSEKDPEIFLSTWLSGGLEKAEKEAFEATPEGEEFKRIIAAAKMLKMPSYDAEKELQRLQFSLSAKATKPTEAGGRVISIKKVWALAAAAAVLIFAATYFYIFSETTYSTGAGEHTAVNLPDGSSAELHANTTLKLRKWNFAEKRNVSLTGEAFFDVQSGSGFRVNTAAGNVDVLGTTFNVKERDFSLEVACYTGKVKVSGDGNEYALTPGKAVKLIKGSDPEVYEHMQSTPDWKSGKSVFDAVPLSDVVRELYYIYGIQVTMPSGVDTMSYTGAFPHSDVEAALKLVMDPLHLDYTWNREQKQITVNGIKP